MISLADDMWGVRSKCEEPSINRLYYSTEFEKRDREDIVPATKGWVIGGCGLSVEDPVSQTSSEWRGCVAATPSVDQDDVPLDAPFPLSAVPYRLGSRPCIELEGAQVATCPAVSTYSAAGALTQRLDELESGYHVVSLFTHLDPDAAPYGATNAPALRVVRESDDVAIAELDITPNSTGWKRFELTFQVDPGKPIVWT